VNDIEKGPDRAREPDAGGEGGRETPKVYQLGGRQRRGSLWRSGRAVGILLQICISALLVGLLLYLLVPFFAAADRLNLSARRVVYLPVAVLVIVVFMLRRILKLVRRLRDGRW